MQDKNQYRACWNTRIGTLVRRSTSRARAKGYAYDITLEWAMERLVAQDFRCARTGAKLLLMDPKTGAAKNPWAPSLDRVDSDVGYIMSNTEIVCSIYNQCKHTFAHRDVLDFCHTVNEIN